MVNWSHALRVRGLKRKVGYTLERQAQVARSTRAWIETVPPFVTQRQDCVARSTRAWIETSLRNATYPGTSVSHALRVRGLKRHWLIAFP